MPYFWWKTWLDSEGRTWAQPYKSGDPVEAKQQHRDHLSLDWGTGIRDPQVSELEFVNENGHSVFIAPGARRDTDTQPTATPRQVASMLQSSKTELPF